jgi:hypothetical protein
MSHLDAPVRREIIDLMRWENEMAKTVIFSTVEAFFRMHSRATGREKKRKQEGKGRFYAVLVSHRIKSIISRHERYERYEFSPIHLAGTQFNLRKNAALSTTPVQVCYALFVAH